MATALSIDQQKIQVIRESARREWEKGDLTRDEKRAILDEMDLTDSPAWIVRTIESVRESRRNGK